MIVDFTATWCGPCRMIAPFFQELSEKYPGLVFLKVDVDQCEVREPGHTRDEYFDVVRWFWG